MSPAAEILHGREQAGTPDENDAVAHSVTGTNRTRSPGCSRLAGVRDGSNMTAAVRPMICHPPGVAMGYTPVCSPAMPTESGRNTIARHPPARRGNAAVDAPHVRKPGHESEHVDAVGPRRVPLDHVVGRARGPLGNSLDVRPCLSTVLHRDLDRLPRRPRAGRVQRARLLRPRPVRARQGRSATDRSARRPNSTTARCRARPVQAVTAAARPRRMARSFTSGSTTCSHSTRRSVSPDHLSFTRAPRAACRECRQIRRST